MVVMRSDWRGISWLALVLLHRVAGQVGGDYFPTDQTPLTGVAVENATLSGCHQACLQLQAAGHADLATFYPDLPADFREQYYTAQQAEMIPTCVVQPRTADAVAEVVLSVRQNHCRFTTKSGGHSIAAGASAINNGLLLDLRYLNQIDFSEDKTIVSVGPGNRWSAVYAEVEKHDLIVVGGRDASVGVGGFLLGGGISFLSRRYGFAMDNVQNFEVVLPNGTVAYANQTSHSDLYFALRGGRSNFGIVTRFDLKTYPFTSVWGGPGFNIMADIDDRKAALGLRDNFDWSLQSSITVAVGWIYKAAVKLGFGIKSGDMIEAFANLENPEHHDLSASGYIILNYIPDIRNYVLATIPAYGQPVEDPSALHGLTSLPSLWHQRGLKRLSTYTQELHDVTPQGSRNYWRTLTFKMNAEFISKLWDIVIVETESYKVEVPDAQLSCVTQLLTKDHLTHSENAGNAFGLDANDGPLLVFLVTIIYKSPKDDERIQQAGEQISLKAAELAEQMGLSHPFLYPNYAALDQDTYAGYSTENQQRLLELQKIYDPDRIFANLQPKHITL
ncbi:hypothetical protein BX600DRAFT_436329 [Xylariales sp. PMI_506]|nr:hypothetical protein BX600DRAFT_436329 [Xylariales sp. PMI_506]